MSELALIVAGAVDYVDGVRQERGEGVEGFHGPFGAAGKIEDQGVMAHNGDAAREDRRGSLLGAFAAHLFGEAGNDFFRDFHRSFRRVISRTEPGAAGGEDQIHLTRIGQLAKVRTHLSGIVGTFKGRGDFPAEVAAALHHSGAGEVHALSIGNAVANGEDRDAHHGRQFEGTASRLASSIRRMASISSPVVVRVVVVLEEVLPALKSISNSPSVHSRTL
jgi:hypothetical protein